MTDMRQVFDDLVRFETMLWSAIDDRLQTECGTSLASLNIMLIIDATPNCRVFDIAQALAITVGGTSQAVDRLEAAGHCRRRSNPMDRRSSILELTPAGTSLLEIAAPAFDRELDRLLRAPLSEVAITRLGGTLGTLRKSAAEAAASQSTSDRTRNERDRDD
jgi:MarR family transcriptional regulator, organic hydroperoxide resistance regulator